MKKDRNRKEFMKKERRKNKRRKISNEQGQFDDEKVPRGQTHFQRSLAR